MNQEKRIGENNMKITTKGIEIHLEQDEISDFVNIILFALDYHEKETKNGNNCMTKSELKLAKELVDITEKLQ